MQDFLSSLSVTGAYWLVRRYRRKSEAQQDALRAAGAMQVFAEKISGVRRDRPALERLLGSLEPGDAVLVTKLDRLARSTRDLLNTLARRYCESWRDLSVAG